MGVHSKPPHNAVAKVLQFTLWVIEMEFPISTPSLRKTIGQPPSRVKVRSPWPRLGGKRGLFGSSAD